MNYISTRGGAPTLDFEQATLAGLASDGGLYLPESWPSMDSEEIRRLHGLTYAQLATAILSRFTGGTVEAQDIEKLALRAYGNFHHDAIAPLKQLDDELYFMELFHGPTLAFKDYALQMLGQFFEFFLERNGRSCTILGATSGDTGSAAIAGVRGLPSINLFMLHPEGRVSEVQRRQMTTVLDNNIHNLAVSGTFDDCQNMVKEVFRDLEFKQRYSLSAVNSINWARIASQVVYYFRAALALGAPDRAVNFSVPTGNFGNVLAGWVALKMGLPVNRLIIGSNSNDILTRFFQTGTMEMKGVTPTLSPSMDIQISSNFERFLFELLDRDSDHLNQVMERFSSEGKFSVSGDALDRASAVFSAYRLNDEETRNEIRKVYEGTGEIIDPHSIIGVSAARKADDNNHPTVVVGTAHPAKFPDAIHQAIGVDVALPAYAGDLMSQEEKYRSVGNSADEIKSIIAESALPARTEDS